MKNTICRDPTKAEESLYKKKEDDTLYLKTIKSQSLRFVQVLCINCIEFNVMRGKKMETYKNDYIHKNKHGYA